ncbi:hypothetical protein Taro_000244 [Colocasia esculenta]|uniref:CRAL-TRIO domain-containing protein n=1 Tax=Colocasia esculenta TaxID=4460 RepID=A0A843TEN0_COLES|nr:hypothetical protein [Colocasia esculenta]
MGAGSQEAIKQLRALIDQVDERLQGTFQNMHQGYPNETLVRFLKAREWNVSKAHKMLLDCLNWRIENEIDNILSKPIVPTDLYRAVRESQLIGLSGYSKEWGFVPPLGVHKYFVYMSVDDGVFVPPSDVTRYGGYINVRDRGFPVFAVGVGLSTFDKASVNYYVQSHIQINEFRDRVPAATKKHGRHIGTCLKVLDMTGLKISALSQIKLLTIISTVDDLNYPEKTETYYIVNVPYIFSACWKVVKPLLQERTRRKVQVLHGCGRDELLKVIDYSSLPHFCRREGSGSSRHSVSETDDCFSLDHHFHQELYCYINEKALSNEPVAPISQGSFHVDVPEPDPEGTKIAQTIECELHKIGGRNGINHSMNGLTVNDD